jgi:replication factor A1
MRISELDSQEEVKQNRTMPFVNAGSRTDADMYTPVKVLNQFSTDWRIKVRVTKKYDIKKWNNARGTGELFTVDLVDADGT